ncbi:hypothetical protein ACFHYQ_01260 [Sphaerimonospora cavernae]|uniref:Uncharacterized protein n=1 Tax=Sphaerimonospora cavernae TaxID=1740611 RepID=A0ABV6TXI7_9ACTN
MKAGDRVLVRPSFHIPVRPWWSEPHTSPFYYPGTVAEVNEQRGYARVELDESLYPAPWESRVQMFRIGDIHGHACGCPECSKPGRDIYRFRADQERMLNEEQS